MYVSMKIISGKKIYENNFVWDTEKNEHWFEREDMLLKSEREDMYASEV